MRHISAARTLAACSSRDHKNRMRFVRAFVCNQTNTFIVALECCYLKYICWMSCSFAYFIYRCTEYSLVSSRTSSIARAENVVLTLFCCDRSLRQVTAGPNGEAVLLFRIVSPWKQWRLQHAAPVCLVTVCATTAAI